MSDCNDGKVTVRARLKPRGMFGYMLVSEEQIDKLVRDVSNDVARVCAKMAMVGADKPTDYARGRFDAANDILALLEMVPPTTSQENG